MKPLVITALGILLSAPCWAAGGGHSAPQANLPRSNFAMPLARPAPVIRPNEQIQPPAFVAPPKVGH